MPSVELKAEEALVLVDLLVRYRESKSFSIQHHAEDRILWDLCTVLESQVPELKSGDYSSKLASARALVASDDWE